MTLLSRYIINIFNRLFCLSLAAFVGIFILIDFFEKVDDFLEEGVGIPIYFLYVLNNIPVAAMQVIPLAILLATFGTIGGLSRSNELTAMRSGGVSIWRIIFPLLGVSFALTLGTLTLTEYLIPVNQKTIHHIRQVEVKGKPEIYFKNNHVWFREGNTIFHIGHSEPKAGILENVTIFEFDDEFRLTSRKDAPLARFSDGIWTFENLSIFGFTPTTGIINDSQILPKQTLALDKKPEDFVETLYKTEQMGFSELRAVIAKLQNEGYDARRYKVDMHARLAQPFSCLAMAILGIPFALRKGRGVSLSLGVTFTLIIGMVYYIIQASLMALGYASVLPPFLAAWSAVFLFILIGFWLLLSARD